MTERPETEPLEAADPRYPVAPPVGPLPRRPAGVGRGEPMSRPARWFTGASLVTAALWLFAFSTPLTSLVWEVVAATATLVLAIVGVCVAGSRRWAKPYRLSPRRPGRAVTTVMLLVVATAILCRTRTPMWLRFYQARPALLELAAEAQRGGGGHRALAGTYYLETFGLQNYRYGDANDPGAGSGSPGFAYFETNTAGLFTDAGYVYSPLGDPAALDRAAGVGNSRYRHLTGPWWTYAQDVF